MLWLIVFGLGLRSTIQFGGTGGGYQSFIYHGIICQTILFTCIMVGIRIMIDKQYGFLKEIMVDPLSRTSIIFGKALGISAGAII